MRSLRVALLSVVLGAAVGRGADVSYYGILKLQEFAQATNSAPAAISNGYSFNAFVVASAAGAVTNATVRRAGTAVTNVLDPQDAGGVILRFQSRFASQAALDTAFPNGSLFSPVNYTMAMAATTDGLQSQNLNFTTIISGYPTTPQVSDLAGGQAIDTTAEYVLKWNSLGGNALDVVQLLITDVTSNIVFATPAPFQSNALTGSSVSASIPPNTLPPGQELVGHLTVARPGLPNTSYATGLPALSRETQFPLATRPTPVAPTLSITPAPPLMLLRFSTEPARTYHLQVSTDFMSWSDLLATNPPAGVVEYGDPVNATNSLRVYRVAVGP